MQVFNPKYAGRLKSSAKSMFPNYAPADAHNAHGGHAHGHTNHGGGAKYGTHPLRDFITVLALSFHAVFEGLAIGLEQDVTDVWTLFLGECTMNL